MTKSDSSHRSPHLPADMSAMFGFDSASDAWLARVRDVEDTADANMNEAWIGGYRLLDEAHRGGQGVVYRAVQPHTRRVVAIKRMLAGALATPRMRQRFAFEAETVATLRHPGIVTIHGVDRVGEQPVLVMEWVDGTAIDAWASSLPDRSMRPRLLDTFALVCDAVVHAHRNGVLHRDLKPANILITDASTPKILDFGLAKSFEPGSLASASLGFCGTPAYAAPESLAGQGIDVRSDVYSLGVVLYEMLTGRRPVVAATEGVVAHFQEVERTTIARPSTHNPGIECDLDAIVLRAVARDRKARYQSVEALVADLRRFRAGEPISATSLSVLGALRTTWRRHRVVASLCMTAMLTISVLAGLAAWQAVEAIDQRNRARAEAATSTATLAFLVEDVLAGANPDLSDKPTDLRQLVDAAAARVESRFAGNSVSEMRAEAAVHHALGSTYRGLGDFAAAEHELRLALDQRCQMSARGGLIAATCYELARLAHDRGNYTAAAERYAEVIDYSGDVSNTTRAAALGGRAELELLGGELVAAQGSAKAGLELIERAGIAGPRLSDALLVAGRVHLACGNLDVAHNHLEAAHRSLGTTPDPARAVGVHHSLAELALTHGQFDAAVAGFRRTVAMIERTYGREHHRTGNELGWLAEALHRRGEPEEATTLARRALRIVTATADRESVELSRTRHRLVQILAARGEYVEAAQLMSTAVARLRATYGTYDTSVLAAMFTLAQLRAKVRATAGAGLLNESGSNRNRRVKPTGKGQ